MMRKQTGAGKGISAGDGLLLGLIALVMVLGGLAVFKSMDAQKRIGQAFEGWYEDAKGYQKALSDQQRTQKPVLVYFYATWCPHCKQFTAQVLSDSKMRDFVKNYPHVRIAPDNGDAEKKLMSEFGAAGYPAFYVLLPKQGAGHQKRVQIDTYGNSPVPHAKTAQEFIDSVRQVTES